MSGWRRVNLLFLVSTTLESFAFGHLTAFTPLYLSELGLEGDEIALWTGLLYATMMAVAFPLAPFWGALAERFSWKLMIVRSQYLAAAAFALTAVAPNVWWLVVARLILGFTFGSVAVIIATQTLLTPRRHLGAAISTIQVANPIAASFGPPLGALMIGWIGLGGLFMVDALAAVSAGLLVTLFMPEPARRSHGVSIVAKTRATAGYVWKEPAVRWTFLGWFMGHGGRSIVDAYLPVRITQVATDPATAIGWILGLYGLLTAASTWVTGRLVDERGGVRWLVPSMLIASLSTVGVIVASNIVAIGLFALARSFPTAAYNTFLYGYLAHRLPPHFQATVMSISPVPRNVASFVWPLLASIVAPIGVGAALALGAVAYAGVSLSALVILRSPPPREA